MSESASDKSAATIMCPILAAMNRDGARGDGRSSVAALARLLAHEGPVPQLSSCEQRVMELMAQGLSNTAIASRLFVSVNTVKTHVRSIFRKLGVNNRSMAVTYSFASGLIGVSESLIHLANSPIQMVQESRE
ncbi:MAG: Response regulator protein VraR [Firmicutes bacterium ADurb.Bin506]|jgi:DNA-binding NarL/FixJ family response regulator|nr:MAG: Response regulator protein VraR [Firmicutes bacterium ADurb.Bin506]